MTAHVLIVSPVSTDESFSMRLYANGLSAVLIKAKYKVSILRIQNIIYPFLLSKTIEVLLRYIFYPIAILASDASIVHIVDHTYAYLAPVVKFTKKTCVVTLHNSIDDILSPKTWTLNRSFSVLPTLSKFLFFFSIRQLQFADCIICVSHYVKNSLIRNQVVLQKLAVIPAPISNLFFTSLTSTEKHIASTIRDKYNKKIILHVGNNDPAHKNIEYILSCLILLKKYHIPVHFIKIGAPFTQIQQHYIKCNNLEKMITNFGQQTQNFIKATYHAADVLLFPSLFEGCPGVPLEALACGLPIVLSDIPAHQELFKKHASFVNLSETVAGVNIIQNPPDTVLSYKDARRFAFKFSWHTINPLLLSFYKNRVVKANLTNDHVQ